jgi:hypothetical protein
VPAEAETEPLGKRRGAVLRRRWRGGAAARQAFFNDELRFNREMKA